MAKINNISEKKYKISVSLLSANFCDLSSQIKEIENSKADEFHFDVMDGHFVPNISMGLPILESIRPLIKKPIEVHMMVTNPDNHIKSFSDAGANIFTFHVESSKNPTLTVETIKETNMLVGVSIKPTTPINKIIDLIKIVDRVLIMTVEPGFGGQKFITAMLKKIESISKIINDGKYSTELAVDGGIKLDNAKSVYLAGASTLISGSGILNSEKGIILGVEDMISRIK